jgi:hypothetical protein
MAAALALALLAFAFVTVLQLTASSSLLLTIPGPLARALAPGAASAHASDSPMLTLVSPSSAKGPVGAHLTVSGSGWSGSGVQVGAAKSASGCVSAASWVGKFGTPALSGDSFTFTFVWPSSVPIGKYYLCALSADGGPAATGVSAVQAYRVSSNLPPALSLSSGAVQLHHAVTITGKNFYGASAVALTAQQGTTMQPLGSVQVNIDGTFSSQYNADGFLSPGQISVIASTPPENGAPAVLSASVTLMVQVAPTATAQLSPTATIDATATAQASTSTNPPPRQDTGGPSGLVIGLVVTIALILVVLVGALAFLLARRRGGAQPGYQDPSSGPGGYGGPSPYSAGVGQTGYVGATGRYGAFGMQEATRTSVGVPTGGVAQWDASGQSHWDASDDSQPGPDWQPRPMSTGRHRFVDPEDVEYDPAPAWDAPQTGSYPPADPWAGATSGHAGHDHSDDPHPSFGRPSARPRSGADGQDGWRDAAGWDDTPESQPGGRNPWNTNPSSQRNDW